jgi:hypothetical protein
MRKSYSSGKVGNYDYSSTKPYESEAEFRTRKLQEQADARERRLEKSASLEGERQRQEYINMGLKLGTSVALTAPLGLLSGTAVGFGSDYALEGIFKPTLPDGEPIFFLGTPENKHGLLRDLDPQKLTSRGVLHPLYKPPPTVSDKVGIIKNYNNTRQNRVSLAEQEAAINQRKAFQSAAAARMDAIKAELDAKEAKYKAAFHKPQYSQNVPFQTATVAPIQYIAPVVNSTDAQKKQRMDVYTTQQSQKLEALKKQNEEVLDKQRSELQTLQNLQKNYYSTLQAEMAKQQSANERVARLEAEQAMRAVQQENPAPRRRLPSTISLEGRVVGRGRRRK